MRKHSDTGNNPAPPLIRGALICLLPGLIAFSSAPALAETYIYKDKDGVYRSAEREPEAGGAVKAKTHTDGVRKEAAPADERLKEFCRNVADVESPSLQWFYLEESKELRKELLGSDLTGDELDEALKRLDTCTRQLESRAAEIKKSERARSARESSERRQDGSFDKLVPLVKERLDERRRSGITLSRERFATPLDIQRMTYPLSRGMSSKDVRDLWGRPLWIYGKKGSQSERWRYPVGVDLHFSNDKLQSWSTYSKGCK